MTATTIAPLSVDELATIVSDLAEHPASWQAQVRFKQAERWWTRLAGDDVADVWLLTWVTDTNTDLHDHGESAGAFTVVSGELEEVRPDPQTGGLVSARVLPGHVCRVDRGEVHDVRSPSLLPAVSIHAYSPPLREMTFYEQRDSETTPIRTVSTQAEGALT